MTVAKVILNDVSQIDLTSDTVTAESLLSGFTAHDASGTQITGTASGGGTVVIYKDTDGYIVIGSEDCGVDGLVSKDSDGYIVIPEELITEIKLQGKTATPTEEYQAIYPDSGYDGLEYVGVNPIPSAYADVTDTTAVATDVAAGKIFYTSEGVRTSGTASGGGGDDVWSVMVDRTISQAIDSMGSFSTIGTHAFESCGNLTIASFPNVLSIGSSGFRECLWLESVSMPNLTDIGSGAFYNCKNLSDVYFPKAQVANDYAFCYCSKLSNIEFFSNLTKIGMAAFASCSDLTVVSNSYVKSLYNSVFNFCVDLTKADFASVSIIGNGAFNRCTSLKEVSFPNALFVYGSAFAACSSLESICLPKAINLSYYAFSTCINLSTVIMGYDAVSSNNANIGNSVFSGCNVLMSAYIISPFFIKCGGANVFRSSPISEYTTYTSGVHGSIFVPESLYSSYLTAAYWSMYSSRFVSLTDAQVQHVIDYGTHEME